MHATVTSHESVNDVLQQRFCIVKQHFPVLIKLAQELNLPSHFEHALRSRDDLPRSLELIHHGFTHLATTFAAGTVSSSRSIQGVDGNSHALVPHSSIPRDVGSSKRRKTAAQPGRSNSGGAPGRPQSTPHRARTNVAGNTTRNGGGREDHPSEVEISQQHNPLQHCDNATRLPPSSLRSQRPIPGPDVAELFHSLMQQPLQNKTIDTFPRTLFEGNLLSVFGNRGELIRLAKLSIRTDSISALASILYRIKLSDVVKQRETVLANSPSDFERQGNFRSRALRDTYAEAEASGHLRLCFEKFRKFVKLGESLLSLPGALSLELAQMVEGESAWKRFLMLNHSDKLTLVSELKQNKDHFVSSTRTDVMEEMDRRYKLQSLLDIFLEYSAVMLPNIICLTVFKRATRSCARWDVQGSRTEVALKPNIDPELFSSANTECNTLEQVCELAIRQGHIVRIDEDSFRWCDENKPASIVSEMGSEYTQVVVSKAWQLVMHGFPRSPHLEPRSIPVGRKMLTSVKQLCHSRDYLRVLESELSDLEKEQMVEVLLAASKFEDRAWKEETISLAFRILPSAASEIVTTQLHARRFAIQRFYGQVTSNPGLPDPIASATKLRLSAASLSYHRQYLALLITEEDYAAAEEHSRMLTMLFMPFINKSEELKDEIQELSMQRARILIRQAKPEEAERAFANGYEYWYNQNASTVRRFQAASELIDALLASRHIREAGQIVQENCELIRVANLPNHHRFRLSEAEYHLQSRDTAGSLEKYTAIVLDLEPKHQREYQYFRFDHLIQAHAGIARVHDHDQSWERSFDSWKTCFDLTQSQESTSDGRYAMAFQINRTRAQFYLEPSSSNILNFLVSVESFKQRGWGAPPVWIFPGLDNLWWKDIGDLADRLQRS